MTLLASQGDDGEEEIPAETEVCPAEYVGVV